MNRLLTSLVFLGLAFSLKAQTYVDHASLLPDDILVRDSVIVPQEVIADLDSVALDSLSGEVIADLEEVQDTIIPLPEYMSKAAFRSWRLSHPLKPTDPLAYDTIGVSLHKTDSLVQSVWNMPIDKREMLYLYDMRLPVINSGTVPTDSTLTLWQMAGQIEEDSNRSDLPIPHYDDVYTKQRRYEEERHLVRFKFASSDPRRFRFARRKFDVPTADSHTIDTKATVQSVRVADAIDMDFGKADVDLFGQSVVFKADKWHWKGDHTFTMQQTALSENWYKGGENNMTLSSEQKLTVSRYDEDKKTTFETTLDMKLSGYYTKADTVHSMRVTDNELSLNVKYGYQAWKNWYYSAQLYAKTPIFDYYKANSEECLSTLFSPLEANISLGVDYQYTSPNKRFVYSILLAPASYDLKAVSDNRIDVTKYGLNEGSSVRHQFGASLTNKFDWKMGENATWSSRLYYFTSYNSVKVEFENTFDFRIGRFFTARVYAYPRFDDSQDQTIEIKEMLTVGFSYQW